MSEATLLAFGRGVQILRGADAEQTRLARISLRRRAAYRRAVWDEYNDADRAMFGPPDELLMLGPQDLQPGRPTTGGPSAA